jgi:hypothetical protein
MSTASGAQQKQGQEEREGVSVMEWFSVHLETRAPVAAARALAEDAAADRLMDLLARYDGIVSAGVGSWSVTISIQAAGSREAVLMGAEIIESWAVKAGLPQWPAVRLEAALQDIVDEENARPALPDLVSAPEAAEILGVSPQRLHQIATDNSAFPEPVYELRAGKLWLRAAVEAFASRERKPGRPRSAQVAAG